jgi:streptomycin 6-kinase
MLGTATDVDLGHYPKSWQLSAHGPVFLHENSLLTPVHSAFGPAMLKCASKGNDLSTSSGLLRWYSGSGSATILKKQKSVQLLEWIDGPSLSDLVNRDQDDLAIDTLAQVIKKLQAPKPSTLKTRLAPLVTTMRPLLAQRHCEDPLVRHAARLIAHLLETTTKRMPLHGDLHFDKIMHDSKRGWLTIAPQGVSGDPHYELASALCHPNGQPDLRQVRNRIQARATHLADALSLDKDRMLTFAFCHASLKTLLADRQGENALHWRDMSTILLDSLVE